MPPFPRPLLRQFPTSRIFLRSQSSTTSHSERLTRTLNRLPKFLHPYTNGLRNAPISHIASFLILHELTAIVPLVGLAGAFHYWGWLPAGWSEGKYINDGVEKFGRYFRRKGWFGFDANETTVPNSDSKSEPQTIHVDGKDVNIQGNGTGSGNSNGMKILVEVATAYAITKVLLPARVILSVWATPWFARVGLGRLGRWFGRGGFGAARRAERTGIAQKPWYKRRFRRDPNRTPVTQAQSVESQRRSFNS
ncbi:hypothetical protein G7Y89_g5591 [Cudoniella acicularis]|uniref:Uncharacterized protein n=1 Tax=Cudoniella acicularis TaxID=354080 RepID=A0A8H4W5K6_9HELO|nr:hypothetical protein G7Y89_g5591 [Cudoniella acicularis]